MEQRITFLNQQVKRKSKPEANQLKSALEKFEVQEGNQNPMHSRSFATIIK